MRHEDGMSTSPPPAPAQAELYADRARLLKRLRRWSLFCEIPGTLVFVWGCLGLPDYLSCFLGPSTRTPPAPSESWVALGLLALGTVLLVVSATCLAVAKGRPRHWGLLGLLGPVGMVILTCLRKRCAVCGGTEKPWATPHCRACGAPV